MITPELISRMSAPHIEQRNTPTTVSFLPRRRVKQNIAGLSSPPAVRAGDCHVVFSHWLATPAHKFHEIVEWLEAKAMIIVAIIISYVILANAPSWGAKAAANVTF